MEQVHTPERKVVTETPSGAIHAERPIPPLREKDQSGNRDQA